MFSNKTFTTDDVHLLSTLAIIVVCNHPGSSNVGLLLLSTVTLVNYEI